MGEIFLKLGPYLKLYTEYTNNYNNALNAFGRMEKSSKFRSIMKQCDATAAEKSGRTDGLSSYLIMPIQRIPRYEMLLKELVKNTGEAHPDYLSLTSAVEQIRGVASHVNERKRDAERRELLYKIQYKLFEGDSDRLALVTTNRELVKEGPVGKAGLYLFLFNDGVLVGREKKKGKRYDYKHWIDIDGYHSNVAIKEETKNGFPIALDGIGDGHVEKHLTLVAQTVEEQHEWYTSIHEQHDLKMAKLIEDREVMRWQLCAVTKMKPRKYHSCTLISKTEIMLFGGVDGTGACFSDVWVYDLAHKKWKVLRPLGSSQPPARYGHTACLMDGSVVVFGGMNSEGVKFDDIWLLELRYLRWRSVSAFGKKKPEGRSHHTAWVYNKTLYIQGGRSNEMVLNDIYGLVREGAWKWREVATSGESLLACAYHSSTLIGTQVVFFGGFDLTTALGDLYVLDCETFVVSRPTPEGDDPEGRYAHSAVAFGPYVVGFGGCSPTHTFGDIFVLDTENWIWLRARHLGEGLSNRGGCASALVDCSMFIHGGFGMLDWTGLFCFEDASALNLDCAELPLAQPHKESGQLHSHQHVDNTKWLESRSQHWYDDHDH